MKRSTARRTGLLMLLTGLVAVLMSTPALGHTGDQSYVYLDIYDTSVEGELHYPVGDLGGILGVDIPSDPDAVASWGEANRGLVVEYAAEHFEMSAVDGVLWPVQFGDLSALEGVADVYLVVGFTVEREFVEVPREFIVTYDGIIHANPSRDALLTIATDFGSGTFNNEADSLLRYTAGNTTQTVDLGETSFLDGVMAVVALGVEHIRIGTDHILFIFALVLPAVLVFVRPDGWEPSASFGASLWRVLKIVTMFTVAHTITLTLGGLGIIELPPAFVETLIAVSIILAALHNIRPVFVNKEWLIAFGFGLIHGFGFAGLLADLGLTQSRQFVSLLGFNIGIEIGQAVIILLIFPALYLARRTRAYQPFMYLGSIVLLVIAAVWAIERSLGFDLGTEWLMVRLTVWPRQLVPVALLYVLAATAYWLDSTNGRLLPVHRSDDEGRVTSPVSSG